MMAFDVTTLTDPMDELLLVERDGPHVVAIGGGTGLPQALRAIRRYAGDISAIVSVADDGGSSGRLRDVFAIPPPGDMRRCLLALSDAESEWRQVFEHRFADGDVAGHSLGNLVLAALAASGNGFADVLEVAGRLLGAVGSVIPAAETPLDLEAVIDGTVTVGQVAIARSRGAITKLRVLPEAVTATPRALDAIEVAEQIILGPGSLFTSIIATLAVPGMVDAINDVGAPIVYVCNLTTQDGETLGMDAADHLDALLAMTGLRTPAAIVAHGGGVPVEPPLEAVGIDPEALASHGIDVAIADLVDPTATWPRHDPARLGAVLGRLM